MIVSSERFKVKDLFLYGEETLPMSFVISPPRLAVVTIFFFVVVVVVLFLFLLCFMLIAFFIWQ